MSVTFNCNQIGQSKTRMISAFDGRAVKIENPFKMVSNDIFKAVQVFVTRNQAVDFCKRWGVTQTGITQIHSRFQRGWVVGLGHFNFVPDHAEGLLFANRMGCVVDSIEDQRMWIS